MRGEGGNFSLNASKLAISLMLTEPSAPPAPLALHLLGPFVASVRGAPRPRLRSRKGQWLLALLALRNGRALERSWLAETLWPESPAPKAQESLRKSLRDLRRALGVESWRLGSPTRRSLSLDLSDVEVDVLAFDAAVARGQRAAFASARAEALVEAVNLYAGPLLEGCLEEWVFAERRVREEAYLAALEQLADAARGRGDTPETERWLRCVVAADPLREGAQRALMRVLAERGSYAAALEVYRELRFHLHREVNAVPDSETQELFQKLRAQARSAAAVLPAAGSSDALSSPPVERTRRHNLPAPVTPFLGRQREVSEVRVLLQDDGVRLVTLTGPGGVGKTRLALQTAAELQDGFEDGVFLVRLASLRNPALIPSAIIQALGLEESGSRPAREVLEEYLRDREILLLMDNFEHLLEAALLPAELLAAAPRLRLLVTSRAVLRLSGEHEYPVPPLALPPLAGGRRRGVNPVAAVGDYAAVTLFVQRARAVRPGFALTDATASSVAEICQRLDGLPLAIELAAARIRVLSPQSLLAQLTDRLGLLVGGPRDLPARQQTLRDTIAWSYELLGEREQSLFRRLSIFVGGCTLASAGAVSGCDTGASGSKLDLLGGMMSLVGQSLIGREEAADGELRFTMLETIREYGRECMARTGEAGTVARQHALFFLRLAEEAEQELRGPRERMWLDRLEQELDNLRAALDWAEGAGEAELGLRLGTALGLFWDARGYFVEGEQRLASLLSLPGTRGTAIRAGALLRAGQLASRRGDLAAARTLREECFAIWEALGDRNHMARTLKVRGALAHLEGDYPTACSLVAKSLAIFRELGDRREIASTSNDLGYIFRSEGAYEAAVPLLEESLEIHRDLGDRWNTATNLVNLGQLNRCRGDYEKSRMLLEEALATGRELDNRQVIVQTTVSLAIVALRQGDLGGAAALCQESLALWREMGDLPGIAHCMEIMAVLAGAQGRLERAVWLSGQASALREATRSLQHEPDFRADYAHHLDALQRELGEEAFASAWAEGQALSLDQAIEFALAGNESA
jgi:predicted ATPase/DNA-binding SARP family transcriptional activator